MSLVLTIWGWTTIKDTDGLSLTEIEHLYDQRHRNQTYGAQEEGTGDSQQVDSLQKQKHHSMVFAKEQNLYTGYDAEPESLTSLPWIAK